jgi:hypothetical protein
VLIAPTMPKATAFENWSVAKAGTGAGELNGSASPA